ncbi:TetR/AcrR family transcriptional regulator [Staphylococcus americanisciuri]|uniref:TetR/AcrR family transcriptional regulator n=1 Tax=Staphylococcus americanisciuri TaxID=2973940 RepID=A0ABT2F0Z3_9STAP|nr:TetR/AcrR family transcriptional regulator [Staphylococcus americanisciuri]MCS4486130.1 TetR/AcrR family transcriptional regulator [Staphylococcus americanisciuri]
MREKDSNKKLKILNATLDLVYTQGLSKLSMSKIAKTADVSPATIYIYFENKEDLINKLYLSTKETMSTAVFDSIDSQQDLKIQYYQILTNFITFIMQNKKAFLFLEQLHNAPVLDDETLQASDELFSTLSNLYQEGIDQKLLKPVSLIALSTATSSIAMEYVKLFHKELVTGTDEEINEVVSIC